MPEPAFIKASVSSNLVLPPTAILSNTLLRNLTDKSYEKRKAAAIEVRDLVVKILSSSAELHSEIQENVDSQHDQSSPSTATNENSSPQRRISAGNQSPNRISSKRSTSPTRTVRSFLGIKPSARSSQVSVTDQITQLITTITVDLACSAQTHKRQGGLLALAAVMIAVGARDPGGVTAMHWATTVVQSAPNSHQQSDTRIATKTSNQNRSTIVDESSSVPMLSNQHVRNTLNIIGTHDEDAVIKPLKGLTTRESSVSPTRPKKWVEPLNVPSHDKVDLNNELSGGLHDNAGLNIDLDVLLHGNKGVKENIGTVLHNKTDLNRNTGIEFHTLGNDNETYGTESSQVHSGTAQTKQSETVRETTELMQPVALARMVSVDPDLQDTRMETIDPLHSSIERSMQLMTDPQNGELDQQETGTWRSEVQHGSTNTDSLFATVLALVLPPILNSTMDTDSRVRFSAMEALYNVAQSTGRYVLPYFALVFHQLVRLVQDVDADIKAGVVVLNNKVMQIVAMEMSSSPMQHVSLVTNRTLTEPFVKGKSKNEWNVLFDVNDFLALYDQHIDSPSPYVGQLLLGWLEALDGMPEVNILQNLPKVLGSLFTMLRHRNREIRQSADAIIGRFCERLALEYTTNTVDLDSILTLVIQYARSSHRFTRLTATYWLSELVGAACKVDEERLMCHLPRVVRATLHCLRDTEDEIRNLANLTHKSCLALVQNTSLQVDVEAIYRAVTVPLTVGAFLSDEVIEDISVGETQTSQSYSMESLQWMSLLLDKVPDEIAHHLDALGKALLTTMHQLSEQAVLLNLEVTVRIASNQLKLDSFFGDLLDMFKAHDDVLERRGVLVVRRLCQLLSPELVYKEFAIRLQSLGSSSFSNLFVHILNLVLLSCPEAAPLRHDLRQVRNDPKSTRMFELLLKSWCISPVAAIGISLFCEQYEVAEWITNQVLPTMIYNVGHVMEFKHLAQAIESPTMLHIRLQLLGNIGCNHTTQQDNVFNGRLSHTLRSVFGIVMALPGYSTRISTDHKSLEIEMNDNEDAINEAFDKVLCRLATATEFHRSTKRRTKFSQESLPAKRSLKFVTLVKEVYMT